jgi:hypothetical protein
MGQIDNQFETQEVHGMALGCADKEYRFPRGLYQRVKDDS